MKTQHQIPLHFTFPDTNEVTVEYQLECEHVTGQEILDAMNSADNMLWIAIDEALKRDFGSAKNIYALVTGIGLLDAGLIDIQTGEE